MDSSKISEQDRILGFALSKISDDRLRQAFQKILGLLPGYFFKVPASSSGKYHPNFSRGEGGLLRHSIAAMIVGEDLMRDDALCPREVRENSDLVLMALFLHDGCKKGYPNEGEHTVFDHPLQMSKLLEFHRYKYPELYSEEIVFLKSAIETHMGPWTTDKHGNEILKVPATEVQRFVHLCDYIASRKGLEFDFSDILGDQCPVYILQAKNN